MSKRCHQLSALLLIAALAGTLLLLAGDASDHLRLTFGHQRTGALSLMLIGASYISLLLGDPCPWPAKIKGLLLGTGFLLWGGEPFMPPGPLMTLMDSLVVLIFVTDLSLVIIHRLRANGGKREEEF